MCVCLLCVCVCVIGMDVYYIYICICVYIGMDEKRAVDKAVDLWERVVQARILKRLHQGFAAYVGQAGALTFENF